MIKEQVAKVHLLAVMAILTANNDKEKRKVVRILKTVNMLNKVSGK